MFSTGYSSPGFFQVCQCLYRWFHEGYTSNVENAQFEFEDTLENIEKNIKANVYEAANELILHFDSFPMSKVATDEIFDKFFGDRILILIIKTLNINYKRENKKFRMDHLLKKIILPTDNSENSKVVRKAPCPVMTIKTSDFKFEAP